MIKISKLSTCDWFTWRVNENWKRNRALLRIFFFILRKWETHKRVNAEKKEEEKVLHVVDDDFPLNFEYFLSFFFIFPRIRRFCGD